MKHTEEYWMIQWLLAVLPDSNELLDLQTSERSKSR